MDRKFDRLNDVLGVSGVVGKALWMCAIKLATAGFKRLTQDIRVRKA